jgi:CheY-like chemotaxis protein
MSFLQSSFELLADVRSHARMLVERTVDHEDQLQALIASAERDVRQAEAAASRAPDLNADQLRTLLFAQAQRSAASAETARRLFVGAHQQYTAARRLLDPLDRDQRANELLGHVVLVADDYGDVRELLASVLQQAGFVVRTAVNGLEALIAAYESRPRVIVMDVTMPVLDGIEATRLIKATEATRHARVIAYTGNGALHDPVASQLFTAVLEKPATPDAVVAAVQQVARL